MYAPGPAAVSEALLHLADADCPVRRAVANPVSAVALTALTTPEQTGLPDHATRQAGVFTVSGDTVVWLALPHEQRLGDLADEPVRVGQVGVGEPDAVVS